MIDTFITAIIIISGCFPGISINISFINDRRITMKYSDLVVPKQSCVCLNLDMPQVQTHILYLYLDDIFYSHYVTF